MKCDIDCNLLFCSLRCLRRSTWWGQLNDWDWHIRRTATASSGGSWGRHRKATHSLEKTLRRNSGGGIVSPCVHTGHLMYNCSRKVCKVETYVFLLCDPKYLCVWCVRISIFTENLFRISTGRNHVVQSVVEVSPENQFSSVSEMFVHNKAFSFLLHSSGWRGISQTCPSKREASYSRLFCTVVWTMQASNS